MLEIIGLIFENHIAVNTAWSLKVKMTWLWSYYTLTNTADEQVYVLVDSWYTSRKLVERCSQKGFHLIGGLRANRKIYPVGIGVKITEFASTFLDNRDLRSVTVMVMIIKFTPTKGT